MDGSVPMSPMRVLLLSGDYRTARQIDEVLRATWSDVHLVTHATWDAAAAEALLDHPGCCVLLDAVPALEGTPTAVGEDPMSLLEYVRMSAPDAPIVLLCPEDDEDLTRGAVRLGAQDCLIKSELEPVLLRRALIRAVERKRAEAQLAHQAMHDQLTGLPNRALFLDRLGVALERSRRSGAPLAVLFLDFDNFKEINDTRGHAAGDRVLTTLGERLSGLLRPMDTVARFGGDEFTFLFEGLTSEREVVLIADRICQAAAGRPIEVDGVPLTVTVSVGIAIVNDPTVSPDAIIREADAAMYRAKDQGRSRYELFDEDSRRRASERMEFEAALRQALERDELRVHYQPHVILHGMNVAGGVEALVRWQHPTRGLLTAGEFMQMTDELGLTVPIGRFVLQQALSQLSGWRARKPDMTLSLNISARQLRDPALPLLVGESIRAGELDPAAIYLDVSEIGLAADPESTIRALQALKDTGVRVTIDDFGVGALSLAWLTRMPVDALKIHESFVANLGEGAEHASLLSALVELGHALGLDVIAKGVETEAQLEQLRELGCDAVQGYATGRPVTGEELESVVVAEVA